MKIPKRLKIGSIWWTVKLVDSTEIDCDGATVGDQDVLRQTIRISRHLSKEMQLVVLLHEILHCINSELEHETVEFLAQALAQVLSENHLLR
jgi:hypothetical protein